MNKMKKEKETLHPMLHGHLSPHSQTAMKEAEGHEMKPKKKMKMKKKKGK